MAPMESESAKSLTSAGALQALLAKLGIVPERHAAGQALSMPERVLPLSAETVGRLRKHNALRPGVFSTNHVGDVFVPTGWGWTRRVGRRYLHDVEPLLRMLAEEVLAVSPTGGRFEVRLDALYLSRSAGVRIVQF